MATPTDRTVPSPERDIELTKEILAACSNLKMIADTGPTDDTGHLTIFREAEKLINHVAAFSARRATEAMDKKIREAEVKSRDKAIGECQAAIAVPLIRDDWEMAQQYFVVLLQKLKSPTN